jgi:hypothetical protein
VSRPHQFHEVPVAPPYLQAAETWIRTLKWFDMGVRDGIIGSGDTSLKVVVVGPLTREIRHHSRKSQSWRSEESVGLTHSLQVLGHHTASPNVKKSAFEPDIQEASPSATAVQWAVRDSEATMAHYHNGRFERLCKCFANKKKKDQGERLSYACQSIQYQ